MAQSLTREIRWQTRHLNSGALYHSIAFQGREKFCGPFGQKGRSAYLGSELLYPLLEQELPPAGLCWGWERAVYPGCKEEHIGTEQLQHLVISPILPLLKQVDGVFCLAGLYKYMCPSDSSSTISSTQTTALWPTCMCLCSWLTLLTSSSSSLAFGLLG